ncbi:hypothetical protein CHCC14821_0137 [Bacillus paralicheniformis]|nr:hypothetical protein CHCC14821_0137 [Bacillus paralicheniformis]
METSYGSSTSAKTTTTEGLLSEGGRRVFIGIKVIENIMLSEDCIKEG